MRVLPITEPSGRTPFRINELQAIKNVGLPANSEAEVVSYIRVHAFASGRSKRLLEDGSSEIP